MVQVDGESGYIIIIHASGIWHRHNHKASYYYVTSTIIIIQALIVNENGFASRSYLSQFFVSTSREMFVCVVHINIFLPTHSLLSRVLLLH